MNTLSPTTNYTASIRGVLHSLDPIYSPGAYARACFGDRINEVQWHVEGTRLIFQVIKREYITGDTTITELCDGLITGDDRNVNWDVHLEVAR